MPVRTERRVRVGRPAARWAASTAEAGTLGREAAEEAGVPAEPEAEKAAEPVLRRAKDGDRKNTC